MSIDTTSAPVTTPSPAVTARPSPLARLFAALRGDKYMVDAYPPVDPPTGPV